MKKWASLAACSGLIACSGTPAPESPKPAPSAVVVTPIAPPAPPSASAPAPERVALLPIGSEFRVDPAEPLPPGAVARCGTTRMRAAAPAAAVVSNAGSIYVVDQVDRRWVLRDVTRGEDLAELPGGRTAVFAPDASAVVVESSSGRLTFHAVPKGEELGRVDIPLPSKPAKPAKASALLALWNGNSVANALFAPGGKTLVVTTRERAVHLVDVATRKITKTLQLPAKSRLAGVSRDAGRAVVENLKDEAGAFAGVFSSVTLTGFTVLDLKTGATLRKETFKQPKPDKNDPDAYVQAPHSGASFQIAADGKTVYRLENHDLAAIDVATGKEEEIASVGKPQAGVLGSGFGLGGLGGLGSGLGFGFGRPRFEVLDDKRAVVGDELINPADGTSLASLGAGFAAISADGEHVATREGSRFRLSSGDPALRLGNDGPVTQLAFLPDNHLATLSSKAMFWNTARCSGGRFGARTARFVATAARKDAAFLLSSAPAVLTPAGEEKIAYDPSLRLGAFAPDGDRLYMGLGGRYDNESRLAAMDIPVVAGGRQQRTLQGAILSIAASPDGAAIAVSTSSDGEQRPAKLHLLAGDSLSTKVEVVVDRESDVAFAGPDRLVLSAEHRSPSVRSLPSLDEVAQLHHLYCCERAAVSPDGKLAAGSEDRGFVIWEIGTRRLVARVDRAHREDITSLAFSADSRFLATGSKDTTVLLWDVQKLSVPSPPEKAETWLRGAAQVKALIEAPPAADFDIKADGTLAALPDRTKLKPPPLKAVTKVVSNLSAHCAISEGKVRCWGSTAAGALGVPEKPGKNRWTPAEVTAPITIPVKDPIDVRMSGRYSCALERGGDLVCWGRLSYKESSPAPRTVLGGVKSFDFGSRRACALGTDGDVRCWESGDAAPAALGVKDGAAIVMGDAHTCFLLQGGAVQCTGRNRYDQLGDDTGVDRAGPVAVQGVSGAVAIVAQNDATCALTSTGSVMCWGRIGGMHFGRATRLAGLDGVAALRIVDKPSPAVCGQRGDRLDCVKLDLPD